MNTENLAPQLSREILQGCPIGVLALDREGRIAWINAMLEQVLGVSAHALVGIGPDSLPRENLKALFSKEDTITVRDGRGGARQLARTRFVPEGGVNAATEIHYFVDRTEVISLRNEKAALEQRVKSLSLADAATGLMNQRAIRMVLEPEVSRSRRYSNSLSIALLRVTFAHGGDADIDPEQVRSVSRLLTDQLRWADLIGRDDAGDFVLVLPETGKEAALALTEKVVRHLEQQPAVANLHFGVTEWNKADDAASLMGRANAALDQACRADDTAIATL